MSLLEDARSIGGAARARAGSLVPLLASSARAFGGGRGGMVAPVQAFDAVAICDVDETGAGVLPQLGSEASTGICVREEAPRSRRALGSRESE